jgi:hypothetical protein
MYPFQYELERQHHADRERQAAQQRLIAEAERYGARSTSQPQLLHSVAARLRWHLIRVRLALAVLSPSKQSPAD